MVFRAIGFTPWPISSEEQGERVRLNVGQVGNTQPRFRHHCGSVIEGVFFLKDICHRQDFGVSVEDRHCDIATSLGDYLRTRETTEVRLCRARHPRELCRTATEG